MSYVNGRLPASALAPIPGGRLAKGAPADSWNALCFEWRKRTGVTPLPNGPDSTYRPYARQVYYRAYWCNQGKCGNAAVPGTSNHGLGLAVDGNSTAQAAADTLVGYGWSKAFSDAPWESWHRRFRGYWNGKKVPVVTDPLTKIERRLVNELLSIRRRVNGRWNDQKFAYLKRRADSIKDWLRAQMKRIRDAAKASKNGWKQQRRLTRYRLLKRAALGVK